MHKIRWNLILLPGSKCWLWCPRAHWKQAWGPKQGFVMIEWALNKSILLKIGLQIIDDYKTTENTHVMYNIIDIEHRTPFLQASNRATCMIESPSPKLEYILSILEMVDPKLAVASSISSCLSFQHPLLGRMIAIQVQHSAYLIAQATLPWTDTGNYTPGHRRKNLAAVGWSWNYVEALSNVCWEHRQHMMRWKLLQLNVVWQFLCVGDMRSLWLLWWLNQRTWWQIRQDLAISICDRIGTTCKSNYVLHVVARSFGVLLYLSYGCFQK